MNRRGFILGLGVIAALTGFAVSPALADGKRVALVIGNSTYRNVPTLPNPANDAADIAAALNRLGFAVTLVTNASFDEMRRGLIASGATRRAPIWRRYSLPATAWKSAAKTG